MRRFTRLYLALDATNRTLGKQQILEDYFRSASPHDAAWAAYFLTGRTLARRVRSRDLKDAALEVSAVPEWLFESSYHAAGDLAETIALLLPPPVASDDRPLAAWVEEDIAPLSGLPPAEVKQRLADSWRRLDAAERFVHLKLITGGFRVGVAKQLVERALAAAHGVPIADVAQRLVGSWQPSPGFVDRLLGTAPDSELLLHRPYPFLLAHALDVDPSSLGPVSEWQTEWKWDGIRAQLVVRNGSASVWSRGESLVDEAFPELIEAARALPDGCVIDGEILVWPADDAWPSPFASLQTRVNRKRPSAKLRGDTPATLCAYDLLERGGADLRSAPLAERRDALASLLSCTPAIRLSPVIAAATWGDVEAARSSAREHRAEGVMLKRRDAPYGLGRPRGVWWKWKVEPFSIDAVLVYAQAGHGRRASLFTDYTFAVWDEGALVPFAKAYTGLTNAEIARVDAWIRAHTLERFGPVRRVEPALVFEIAFEGLQRSTRHKSGVAVRFPRILRWREDKPAAEADTLASLGALAQRGRA